MTIRDSAQGVVARTVAGVLVVMMIGLGVVACGQRGPLRLPNAAASASPVAVQRGLSAASAVDARDPFTNPSPTAAPASVPRP